MAACANTLLHWWYYFYLNTFVQNSCHCATEDKRSIYVLYCSSAATLSTNGPGMFAQCQQGCSLQWRSTFDRQKDITWPHDTVTDLRVFMIDQGFDSDVYFLSIPLPYSTFWFVSIFQQLHFTLQYLPLPPASSSPLVMRHILPPAEWIIFHLIWTLEAELNPPERLLPVPSENSISLAAHVSWRGCSHSPAWLIYTWDHNWD